MMGRKPLRVLAVLLDHLVLRLPLRLRVFPLRLLLFLFRLPVGAGLCPWIIGGERRHASANSQNTQQDQRGKSHSLSSAIDFTTGYRRRRTRPQPQRTRRFTKETGTVGPFVNLRALRGSCF